MFLSEFCEHDTLTCASCNPQSGTGALPCDAWHHYYHYQSSAQYLWLAETLRAQGRTEEMQLAYKKAIFQDHFNREALEGKERKSGEVKVPDYDKHPLFDLEFCSLTGQQPGEATRPHDEGARHLMAGEIAQALACFTAALEAEPHHSNSRFGRGKCQFLRKDYAASRADLEEAIRLSHLRHDLYHRLASMDHVKRGKKLLAQGELDLAVNDFTKALDLHRGNKDALAARAEAYRAKGNEKLAREDEGKLQ